MKRDTRNPRSSPTRSVLKCRLSLFSFPPLPLWLFSLFWIYIFYRVGGIFPFVFGFYRPAHSLAARLAAQPAFSRESRSPSKTDRVQTLFLRLEDREFGFPFSPADSLLPLPTPFLLQFTRD